MPSQTIVSALPVGEFDTDQVRVEFDAILGAFKSLGIDPIVAEPVSDEAGARRFVHGLADQTPDLLLLIPLRGLSAQTIEAAARLCPAPCLIWPVQGRFALPSSALAAGALREARLPVELLFSPPDHPRARERARRVARAGTAFSRLRRSRIGVVGGLFPNLVSCRYDPQTVSSRLGATLVPIAFDELRAGMQSASPRMSETEPTRNAITSSYGVDAADVNALTAGIKLHLALKQAAQDQRLDAFATECWTGLPRELGLNPCLGFVEDAYTLACEGDVMLCVSLLIVRYLTGARAYVGDLFDVDLDGSLTLVHCGGPASLAANRQSVVLAKSQLALERGFETITCRPRLQAGPVTLFRLYGQDCDQMHVALGELARCEQSPNLSVSLKLAGDRWDFLSQCFGNHYVVAPGDIRHELNLLAQWLGIRIVET
jgi:L-fucose isomerase-like protein